MKKVIAVVLALVFVIFTFAACGVAEEKLVPEPIDISAAEPMTEAPNYTLMKEKAEKVYENTTFFSVNDSSLIWFDTHSGCVYYKNIGNHSCMVVLYQTDGCTPRNIYHENGVYSKEAIVKWLLENYWEQLKTA